MKLKDFDELLELLKQESSIQNEDFKNSIRKKNEQISNDSHLKENTKRFLIREVTDSLQYLDVKEFLKNDFKNLSNDFKRKLIEFYNSSFVCLFNEFWMKDFYLLKDAIQVHLELNIQRKLYNFPYEDIQKYNKRIKTLKSKCNSFMIPKLQAYQRIKFFQNKANELIRINTLECLTKNKREKEELKKEVIFEFIKILTNDNYIRELKNKVNMRLTKKTSSTYLTEIKEFEQLLKTKSIKKYHLKP